MAPPRSVLYTPKAGGVEGYAADIAEEKSQVVPGAAALDQVFEVYAVGDKDAGESEEEAADADDGLIVPGRLREIGELVVRGRNDGDQG